MERLDYVNKLHSYYYKNICKIVNIFKYNLIISMILNVIIAFTFSLVITTIFTGITFILFFLVCIFKIVKNTYESNKTVYKLFDFYIDPKVEFDNIFPLHTTTQYGAFYHPFIFNDSKVSFYKERNYKKNYYIDLDPSDIEIILNKSISKKVIKVRVKYTKNQSIKNKNALIDSILLDDFVNCLKSNKVKVTNNLVA